MSSQVSRLAGLMLPASAMRSLPVLVSTMDVGLKKVLVRALPPAAGTRRIATCASATTLLEPVRGHP
jgi:hypothetical protein